MKDLQCIKEYVELITNMQEQINKLQTDIENQKNTGQTPIAPVVAPESPQSSTTDKADVPEAAPVSPIDANQPPVTN